MFTQDTFRYSFSPEELWAGFHVYLKTCLVFVKLANLPTKPQEIIIKLSFN